MKANETIGNVIQHGRNGTFGQFIGAQVRSIPNNPAQRYVEIEVKLAKATVFSMWPPKGVEAETLLPKAAMGDDVVLFNVENNARAGTKVGQAFASNRCDRCEVVERK